MKNLSPTRQALNYAALAVITVFMLLPFVWVFFGSFKTQAEFLGNPGAWFPESFQIDNYVQLFADRGFGNYMLNSIIVSLCTTAEITPVIVTVLRSTLSLNSVPPFWRTSLPMSLPRKFSMRTSQGALN